MKYCEPQQVSIITNLPKSVFIALNFRKARSVSDTAKSATPIRIKQKEDRLVLSYLERAVIASAPRMIVQPTNKGLLGNFYHSKKMLSAVKAAIKRQPPILMSLNCPVKYLTWSPILKATMQTICEAAKKRVPTIKEESSLNMRSTSPTKDRSKPSSTRLGIRCSLEEFLLWMQIIMSTMGRGFRFWSSDILKPQPMISKKTATRMQKLRRGQDFSRLPLFNRLLSFFWFIIIQILQLSFLISWGVLGYLEWF